MIFWNLFDGALLLALATCVVVWPTQWITDNQNRWLRRIAVTLVVIQVIATGPRLQLAPAYLVAALFAVLLVFERRSDAPSAVREAKQGKLKTLVRGSFIAGIAVILTLSIALVLFFPRYEYPVSAGEFAIGVHTLRLSDPTRLEVDTADPNDVRELIVRISYPVNANTARSHLNVDTSLDAGAVAIRYGLMAVWPTDSSAQLIPFSWARMVTHGLVDAPAAQQAFPVLVYSHGLGSIAEQNTILTEQLVSHGYVVVTINHSGFSTAFERSDGKVIGIEPMLARGRSADDGHVVDPAKRQRSAALNKQLEDPKLSDDVRRTFIIERAALSSPANEATVDAHRTTSADQRFVLDELRKIQSDDPILSGRLDLDHVGVLGMSMGGTASHLTCAVDARCKAGLNMDGFQALLLDAELPVPFMHMSDGGFFNHNVLLGQAKATSYLVRVKGSAHGSFTDIVYTHPRLGWLGPLGRGIRGTIGGERMVEITNAYVLAFFDKHLRGKSAPLLDKPSERFPEVEFSKRDYLAHTSK